MTCAGMQVPPAGAHGGRLLRSKLRVEAGGLNPQNGGKPGDWLGDHAVVSVMAEGSNDRPAMTDRAAPVRIEDCCRRINQRLLRDLNQPDIALVLPCGSRDPLAPHGDVSAMRS